MAHNTYVGRMALVAVVIWVTSPLAERFAGVAVSGSAVLEEGQIVGGHYNLIDNTYRYVTTPVPYRLWLHRSYISVRLESVLGEHLRVNVEPEVRVWFNTYPSVMIQGSHTSTPFRQYTRASILEGQGVYSFFGNDNPALRLGMGIFPIKYNQDAINLGEYLFRSGAGVPYIVNRFDYPFATLTGFHLSSELYGMLEQHLLLHKETQIQPLHNWSLSYIAQMLAGPFSIGGGVSLHHWFDADPVLTSVRDTLNRYFTKEGDTAYFSFKGIKVMGRFSFDIKKLLPGNMAGKFGENELRLFAEAAVLGTQNRPAYTLLADIDPSTGDTIATRFGTNPQKNYYAAIAQRVPVMFGLNFPTASLLDYCSVAFEHFSWPEKNAFYREHGKRIYPMPPMNAGASHYTAEDYRYDSWKWSLNVKKTVYRGFSLIGQVARDHLRHEFWQENQRDDEEIFTRSSEWYWMLRLKYAF